MFLHEACTFIQTFRVIDIDMKIQSQILSLSVPQTGPGRRHSFQTVGEKNASGSSSVAGLTKEMDRLKVTCSEDLWACHFPAGSTSGSSLSALETGSRAVLREAKKRQN